LPNSSTGPSGIVPMTDGSKPLMSARKSPLDPEVSKRSLGRPKST
jgi:hypothetical protein